MNAATTANIQIEISAGWADMQANEAAARLRELAAAIDEHGLAALENL